VYVRIQAGDTVDSLARQYLGSAALASEIITANRLDPPYITSDPNFVRAQAASGTVQFTLTGAGPVTVPAGQELQNASGPSGQIRTYTTQAAVTLQSTGNQATVQAVCTVPGPLGNLAPFRVTVVVGLSGVSVTNTTPMSGGYVLNVLSPGDQIWIPDPNQSEAPPPGPGARLPLSLVYEAGGTGIYVTPTGGFQWGTDDLATVDGPTAIGVEVANRLRVLVGSVFYDPPAGSYLPGLPGTASPDIQAQATVLAQSAALQDDRVAAASFAAAPLQPSTPGWLALEGVLTLRSGVTTSQSVVLPTG
jgi:hypothetical protein